MSETVSSQSDIVRADKEECNLSSEHGENCPRGWRGKKESRDRDRHGWR